MKHVFFIIALIMPVLLSAQVNNQEAYGNNASAGKYAEIRGIKMYYETYGSGQPLLLIHGNSGSIRDWSAQIPYFAGKYRVIVADSRDHGNTLDTFHMQDSLSYEMMSDDYDALLTYLKIDSALVVGWSDGGINGLLLAMRHPQKVKKLAVTGANLWPDTTAIDPFVHNMFLAQYKRFEARPQSVEKTVVMRHYKLIFTQPNIPTTALKQINCPTLVMAGDHDVIRLQHTILIAQSIPNSNVWIAPNAGHGLPVLQYKNNFNKEVDDFFSRTFKKIQGYDLMRN